MRDPQPWKDVHGTHNQKKCEYPNCDRRILYRQRRPEFCDEHKKYIGKKWMI